MTVDQLHGWFIEQGWTEYPSPTGRYYSRCYELTRAAGPPNCDCNDKPPGIHAQIYDEKRMREEMPEIPKDYRPTVEFTVFGEKGGRWMHAKIYSIHREEVPGDFPRIKKAAIAVWQAFCNSMEAP